MRPSPFAVGSLTCLLVCLMIERAEASGFVLGFPDGFLAPVGLNLGYGAGRNSAGAGALLLGLEASVVYLTQDQLWFGIYADGLHDFGAAEQRFSTGPEFGVGPFGVDGGLLLLQTPEGLEQGMVVRPLLTVGILAAYGRLGYQLTHERDAFAELGLLAKYPLGLE